MKLTFPSTDPPRSISTNGTHYFIYFAFVFKSSYELTIAFPIEGDINYDGKVDMRDISTAARAFNSTPESPNWNAHADINDDLKIDMRDIGIAARNFGQKW